MELFTKRLLIREMAADDWQAVRWIVEDFIHSDVAVYDCAPPVDELPLRQWIAEMDQMLFAVLPRDTGEVIGYICFHGDSENYDMGYCFHSGSHGNGYALEGCGALLRHMTETRGIGRFSAGTALENRSSVRLLERLGFALDGTETLSLHKDGNGKDISFTGGNFSYTPHPGKTD